MAVITPASIIRSSMGSLTLFTNQCNGVTNGDTLNCPVAPVLFWATVTSSHASGNSALVSISASGATLTVAFTAQPVNLQVNYACAA